MNIAVGAGCLITLVVTIVFWLKRDRDLEAGVIQSDESYTLLGLIKGKLPKRKKRKDKKKRRLPEAEGTAGESEVAKQGGWEIEPAEGEEP